MTFQKIMCPYCFHEFNHDEVHFRSDTVKDESDIPLPDNITSIDEFKSQYMGKDKDAILQQLKVWEFFTEKPDEKYEAFWEMHGRDPNDQKHLEQERAYMRPVIDPKNSEHQQYLRRQPDGGYLMYDEDGFAEGIQDLEGESTESRVCPYCHNPLPLEYGKYPIKFVAVIGITGSGKTVYLSQLLNHLVEYAAKVGQSAVTPPQARNYVKNNPVQVGEGLPGATPENVFLEPLFYEFQQKVENRDVNVIKNTFVIYDIAGESCVKANKAKVAGFIEHADGIILLIDPIQFQCFQGAVGAQNNGIPQEVLNAIHSIKMKQAKGQCVVPIAVCISKSDMPAVRGVLGDKLSEALMQVIEGERDPSTDLNKKMFNSKAYNPIGKQLREFVAQQDLPLETMLQNNYACYNYFAISSLGCAVENNTPVGPITPSRIEEPMLWLWHNFGYIGAEPPAIRCGKERILCPVCRSDARRLPEEEREREERHFLKKYTVIDEYECLSCGHRW